ncbi:MAG: PIG-L family deacetylase [Candidatus Bathyarchaeia archaeon]
MKDLTRNDFTFYNLQTKKKSRNISMIFPDWKDDESVAVICPHDDDGLLGCAYAWLAARTINTPVYMAILCNGSCGYSHPEEKDTIVETRIKESSEAYRTIGINEDHIIRFSIDDFCLGAYMEWKLPGGYKGVLEPLIRMLREKKVTRVIAPNDYREHPDHLAASLIASYISPQAGDNIVADWGAPSRVRSYLKYSVWAELDPSEPPNVAVKASWKVEEAVRKAVEKFESQRLVIQELFTMRDERKLRGDAIEVYRIYDPRPKMDLAPFKRMIRKIDIKSKR